MKAHVLSQHATIDTHPLKLTDVKDPTPTRDEILIRVEACGICRTDLHVIEGELQEQTLPIIPGHQIVGRVESMGTNAQRFQIGDRVGVAWLRHTCGKCEFCTSQRENLCPNQRFTGYHENGGYAELATVDENYAYKLPTDGDPAPLAPLLCAGIIGYRALKRAQLPANGKLCLFGFGSSAHILLQLVKKMKHTVYVVTRDKKHQQLARELGADWASGTIEGIPSLVESAIIFAPAGELVPNALEVLSKGGTLSLAGIHMSDIPKLNYEKHLFYEKNVHSVTANTRQDGREFLENAFELGLTPHITSYSFNDANQALQDLKQDRLRGSGVLVL